MNFVQVRVEAYSGFRANERPLAFFLEGERLEVVEVLDRWYEGGVSARGQKLDYFKVRVRGGREFMLRYNALFDVWSIMVPGEQENPDAPGR